MKIAYLDCFSGISGDMFLGAMLDAGLPLETLTAELSKLGLDDAFEVSTERVMKGAMAATKAHIKMTRHEHAHRHLSDITDIIKASGLDEAMQSRAIAIFTKLAEAEAKVHGTTVDHVHFHEVGAIDSIVDIVGAAIGLEALGIEMVYASRIPVGAGQVETQHGTLPLPAPATLELLTAANAPIRGAGIGKEMVTPTGAAILASQAVFGFPSMRLDRLGIGAGGRDLPWPNVLRLWLGESGGAAAHQGEVSVLETNIDDMAAEAFGHVMGRLFKSGALDVFLTPIQMKKDRPATMLSVIARVEDEPRLARLLLEETTTLGVRVQTFRRYEAERRRETVETVYGEIPVKLKILDGEVVMASPEYDVCAHLADENGVPLLDVYRAALKG